MRDPRPLVTGRNAIRYWQAYVVALLIAVAGCNPSPPPPPTFKPNELVALVRPGPAIWFPGPDGEPSGFDHELLTRFARDQGLALRVITVPSAGDLIARLARGEGQVGLGGLFQAAGKAPAKNTDTDPADHVLWTSGTLPVEAVLIYNIDGYKPRTVADLEGATVVYPEGTGFETQLASTRLAHPEIHWKPLDVPSSDALIAQVSEGSIDYAIVPSNDAAVARNIYLDFDAAFTIGPRRLLAWAVAPGQSKLRDALDNFFARLRSDGVLAREGERFFAPRSVERIDAGIFHDRIKGALPQFRKMFEVAQDVSGIEWRLLAAVAYQESQWDAFATSETGVRGFMQLTEETARHLGVADRLDTRASITAAAKYLQTLKSKLPGRIPEPDRTWLALAAFNIGIAHLEDARVLAQKQKLNPDVWIDVKKTLPLLAQPEYYESAKYGYARGGMPVAFVDRVRAYYDILLRSELPHKSRLRLSAEAALIPPR